MTASAAAPAPSGSSSYRPCGAALTRASAARPTLSRTLARLVGAWALVLAALAVTGGLLLLDLEALRAGRAPLAAVGAFTVAVLLTARRALVDRGLVAERARDEARATEARFRSLDVRGALEASGLEPRRLVLELTESVLVRDREHTLRVLASLKRLGLRVAIDDFGTGYASLSYLRSFPLDVLKVAKTFVDGVHEGGDGLALAHAIISLGSTLHLETVAEGIETAHQARELSRMGCARGQGFLFSPALAPEAFEGYLERALQGLPAASLPLSA